MNKYWSGTKKPTGRLRQRPTKLSEIREARKSALIQRNLAHLRDEDGFTKQDMECAQPQYNSRLIDLDESLAIMLCGHCRHEGCHERKRNFSIYIHQAQIDARLAKLQSLSAAELEAIANEQHESDCPEQSKVGDSSD